MEGAHGGKTKEKSVQSDTRPRGTACEWVTRLKVKDEKTCPEGHTVKEHGRVIKRCVGSTVHDRGHGACMTTVLRFWEDTR